MFCCEQLGRLLRQARHSGSEGVFCLASRGGGPEKHMYRFLAMKGEELRHKPEHNIRGPRPPLLAGITRYVDGRTWPKRDEHDVRLLFSLVHHVTGVRLSGWFVDCEDDDEHLQ